MKTAVEWLELEFVKLETKFDIVGEIYNLCEQAKEMEKQQIIDARVKIMLESNYVEAEQYYNETFKSE